MDIKFDFHIGPRPNTVELVKRVTAHVVADAQHSHPDNEDTWMNFTDIDRQVSYRDQNRARLASTLQAMGDHEVAAINRAMIEKTPGFDPGVEQLEYYQQVLSTAFNDNFVFDDNFAGHKLAYTLGTGDRKDVTDMLFRALDEHPNGAVRERAGKLKQETSPGDGQKMAQNLAELLGIASKPAA